LATLFQKKIIFQPVDISQSEALLVLNRIQDRGWWGVASLWRMASFCRYKAKRISFFLGEGYTPTARHQKPRDRAGSASTAGGCVLF